MFCRGIIIYTEFDHYDTPKIIAKSYCVLANGTMKIDVAINSGK